MAHYTQKAYFNDRIPGSTAPQPTVQAGLTVINAKADSNLVMARRGNVQEHETVIRAHELVFVEKGSNVIARSHSAAELEITSPASLVFGSFAGLTGSEEARRAARREVQYFGIAKTEPQGTSAARTPHAAGVAVQIGGVVTIKNRSNVTLLAGQSLMWDVPKAPAEDVGRMLPEIVPYNPHTASYHGSKMYLHMQNALTNNARDSVCDENDGVGRAFDALMSIVLTGVVAVLEDERGAALTEQQILQYAQKLLVLRKPGSSGAVDTSVARKVLDKLFGMKYTPSSRTARKSSDSTILPLQRGSSSDANMVAAKVAAQMDKLFGALVAIHDEDKSRIFATALTTAAPQHFVDVQLTRHV